MNEKMLKDTLKSLPLGWIEYHQTIGSTNDRAAEWAESDAPDLSIVIADEQTKGRGRFKRKWFTPPGTALAFTILLSIVQDFSPELIMRLTALGAVAVREALMNHYGIPAQIKWPNDVLINRQKTCGVLVESHWLGADLQGVLLGIGVNVFEDAVPKGIELNFPATCVQVHTEKKVDRIELLKEVITGIVHWKDKVQTKEFINAWTHSLAFVGEQVEIRENDGNSIHGRLLGISEDGKLELKLHTKEVIQFQTAEIHLRPAVDRD